MRTPTPRLPSSALLLPLPKPPFHTHNPTLPLPFAAANPTTTRPPPLRRPFTTTPLQTLTATRILPHRTPPLYDLIANISAYPSFIPYCTSSAITSFSAPDATYGKKWPRTADLRIGYGLYDEVFRSRVFCLPYTVLEAVAGDAETTIPKGRMGHYFGDGEGEGEGEKPAGNNPSIFTSLLTRWTFKEFPFKPAPPDGKSAPEQTASEPSQPRTEVNLVVEVMFSSAVYSALSQAAAPKVAGIMIEAFEKRARAVLGAGAHGGLSRAEEDAEEKSALEGVTRGKDRIM